MNPSAWRSRRLIPRWRSLSATLDSEELAFPRSRLRVAEAPGYSLELLTSLEKWKLEPGLITAAELVETAIVSGNEKEAVNAARLLITIDANATPLIQEQAARLMIRTGHQDEVPKGVIPSRGSSQGARHRVHLDPRDALAWVELALQQTIRGHVDAALHSMKVAMNLAPSNRHIIRSAARLSLHAGDPEKAHSIVARNDATPRDPWLLASEIALAAVSSRKPRFFKVGRRLLEQADLAPRQITELAGAIATEELVAGNRRKSRRTFEQSMLNPTGSALAQGEWATPSFGDELVPVSRFSSAPEPAEAVAMHHYRRLDFKLVLPACEGWALADPFSIRPFEFAAATANMMMDYAKALDFANRGLASRSGAPSLLNSAAFALASLGQANEADDLLRQIPSVGIDEYTASLTAANRGLVAFRKGNIPSGIAFYQSAIDGFRRQGNNPSSARARIFLARESLVANLPNALDLVDQAKKSNENYMDSDVSVLISQLDATAELVRKKSGGLNL